MEGSPAAFALPTLERDFLRIQFDRGLPFTIFYHTASVALSVGLGFSLFTLPNSGTDWAPDMLLHLSYVLVSFAVQHIIASRPEMYHKMRVPLNTMLRIFASLRCFRMRRVFLKPPMFDAPISLQSFFFDYAVGALVVPFMMHSEGLPLPFGLHTLTHLFLLAVMMYNNKHYCGPSRLGAFKDTPGNIATLAKITSPVIHGVLGNLIPVPMGPSTLGVPHEVANTCEAQLAFLQIFPMAALYVYGIVREVKLRRLFLSAKHPHLMGASRWPLDGNEVMMGIAQTVFGAVACSILIWEGYLAYLTNTM